MSTITNDKFNEYKYGRFTFSSFNCVKLASTLPWGQQISISSKCALLWSFAVVNNFNRRQDEKIQMKYNLNKDNITFIRRLPQH